MGRFEKKLNSLAKQDVRPFEEWHMEREEFHQFEKPRPIKKAFHFHKAWKAIAVSAASLLVVVGATVFATTALQPQIPDEPALDYAETEIYTTVLPDAEATQYMNTAGFDLPLQYTAYHAIRTIKNDKLIFMTFYGEVETASDYYLLTFKFHLDERYHFLGKAYYESLEHSMTVNDYQIWYEYDESFSAELKTYNLKIIYNETTCYLEMQCFENDFNAFIALLAN